MLTDLSGVKSRTFILAPTTATDQILARSCRAGISRCSVHALGWPRAD